jgi:hypothetical protein
MSHLVSIETRMKDPAAVAAACQRMGLPAPVQGTAQFYSGEATGLLVHLPGWVYPAVIDPQTGTVRCDTYEGGWGDAAHLDRFLQMYVVEECRLQARGKGYPVSEQQLADGSIRVEIVEGAA